MSIQSEYSEWKEVIDPGQRKTLREQGSVLPIKAINQIDVYHIDHGIIPDTLQNQNKCDYFIYNPTTSSSKFIELKGIDTEHACDQIHDTVVFFEQDDILKNYVNDVNLVKGYIISPNGAVPDITSSHRRKLCDKLSRKSRQKLQSLFDYLIFVKCISKITGQYKQEELNTNPILVDNNHPLNF